MRVDTNPMEVLAKAEEVVLDDSSSREAVLAAIAEVDKLHRPDYSRAIRRTLQHEANHRPE